LARGLLVTADVAGESLPLLEREGEMRKLEALLAAAREGSGKAVLIEANAGKGKSRLLAEAAALAREAGMAVLRARGDQAERDFPFGVALQLFEPRLHWAGAAEQAELLAGAAGLAEPLFEARPSSGEGVHGSELFSLAHGLYWLTHNLAERCPLLVEVDNLQWVDTPSLRFLAYLARRLGGLPVALVVARRLGRDGAAEPLESLAMRRLRLAPLSGAAVAHLVRLRLPDASDAFCAACAQATAGNPFFVEELVRTVIDERLPPSEASVDAVRALAPEAVSRFVLLRLSRFAPDAVKLARAVAVLGEAPLADVAALAGVAPDEAAALVGELVGAGILADRELLAFSHPIVREAVYADIARAERGTLQLRAAALLRAAGAAPERVSAHLLAAPPSRNPGVVEPLCLAAANALAEGAPESAVRYLRRALDEPPAADALPDVLFELGQAETATAQPEAPERFRAALALRDDPLWRAQVQLQLGRALAAQGRFVEATQAFELGEAEARGREPELFTELEAAHIGVSMLDPALRPAVADRVELLVRQPPGEDTPAQRPLLANVAVARAWAGAPPADVLPLAQRAWADGALLAEQGPDAESVYVLTAALYAIDELELDLEVLDGALGEARRRGSVMAVATASYCRSGPLYSMARIPEALADAEQAVRAEQDGWAMLLPSARAFMALALLELDDVDAAERALTLQDPERWAEALPYAPFLDARSRLRLAQRRPREALADALEEGRLLDDVYGGTGRGYLQWRSTATLAAAASGDRARAAGLCAEELELARASDRPHLIGAALRTAAGLADSESRIELLSEAVDTLERSQTVLELLRALVELGAALRRAGRRQQARPPLQRALDLATSRGAAALAARAHEELLAAGARPRRTALRGVAALTPSELRVARLAAEGLRNREIAEALFVSRKTVDYHLHHVYQKLNTTREGLAETLAGANKD
jgi:DNA-binding CsgD family transcriptional regulator